MTVEDQNAFLLRMVRSLYAANCARGGLLIGYTSNENEITAIQLTRTVPHAKKLGFTYCITISLAKGIVHKTDASYTQYWADGREKTWQRLNMMPYKSDADWLVFIVNMVYSFVTEVI